MFSVRAEASRYANESDRNGSRRSRAAFTVLLFIRGGESSRLDFRGALLCATRDDRRLFILVLTLHDSTRLATL